jgi:hypothetical protein
MPYYTAIVTLLAGAFYFSLATRVSVAHSRFNVRPPATTGNPDFERIFRAHMNTLEWMPTFGAAVALCNLLERRRRYSARCRLDRGLAVHRRGHRRCHALVGLLSAGSRPCLDHRAAFELDPQCAKHGVEQSGLAHGGRGRSVAPCY